MRNIVCIKLVAASLAAAAMAGTVVAQESTHATCKAIHAVMIEQRVTEGCKPEHAFCFLGEVSGDHGMRGTTYFKADGTGSRPTTSPDFLPYSGPFEYNVEGGTLVMRETGVSNSTQGNPDSGAVTAFQKIVSGTGELAGATGHFFVSGFSRNGRVETTVSGEVCFP
jgi:hypothetical protein